MLRRSPQTTTFFSTSGSYIYIFLKCCFRPACIDRSELSTASETLSTDLSSSSPRTTKVRSPIAAMRQVLFLPTTQSTGTSSPMSTPYSKNISIPWKQSNSATASTSSCNSLPEATPTYKAPVSTKPSWSKTPNVAPK